MIVSRFPLPSQPLGEFEELERQGQPVVLIALRADARDLDQQPWRGRVTHVRVLSARSLAAVLVMTVEAPVKMLELLWWIVKHTILRPRLLVRSLGLAVVAARIARESGKTPVDHLHAHDANHCATLAVLLSHLIGCRFSFTVHGEDLFADRSLLRRKLRMAAFVRSASEFNRGFLETLFPIETSSKTFVGRVGVAPRKPPEPVRSDDGLLIFCATSFDVSSGTEYLVDACRILRDRGIVFRCVISGDGPRRDLLRRRIVGNGLSDRIRLVPSSPQGPDPMADLFVLPAIIGADGRMVGIASTLVAAMAAGVAVVCSAVSGIPEIVEDGVTGRLVDPANPVYLADAIEQLSGDAALRKRLAGKGRERVLRMFDRTECTSRLVAAFDRVTNAVDPEICSIIASVAAADDSLGVRREHRSLDSAVFELCGLLTSQARETIVKRHLSRAGESRPPAQRAADEWQILNSLARHFAEHEKSGIPRPLRLEGATLLMERAAGVSLLNVIREARVSNNGKVDVLSQAVRGVGAWLDHFQRFESGDGVESVRELAHRALFDAERAGVARLKHRIEMLRDEILDRPVRAVSQHGDFWPGNIFVAPARIDVIDFEGYGLGLAAADVAHFFLHASLYFVLRGGHVLDTIRERFFGGYMQPLDPEELELCRIAAALRLAVKDDRISLPHRLIRTSIVRRELAL